VSDYIGFKRISWKTVAVVIAIFILTFAAIAGLETLYSTLTHSTSSVSANSSFMTDTYNTAGWLPLLWIAVVGFAPVFEEVFFRGFIFVGLQRSCIGAAGTILLTSLVWASLHLQYNIIGMATIVIFGIVLGVVRLKTRSLWSTILLHSLWNFVALVATAASLRG
jgi:membrane protease YdiL (CAAX protease family)